jgi:hypothetical protein
MAGSLDAFAAGHLTPAPSQQTLAANYLSAEDFDFVSQYLPELDANVCCDGAGVKCPAANASNDPAIFFYF